MPGDSHIENLNQTPFVTPLVSSPAEQRKTLALSSLGGALEFYDFVVFVFWTPTISTLFFPQDSPEWVRVLQTFGIFAAGYMVRPLGGIIMGHFGDLIGRKRMFMLSVLMMALPTLAIAFIPTYQTIGVAAPILLLICRMLQGAAVGGEVPGSFVFASEHVPDHRVGFACGILQAGLCCGNILGAAATLAITSLYTPAEILEFAWRIPFFLGGIFGLFAMYLRKWLRETPVFIELQKRKSLEKGLPLATVLKKHRLGVAVSMILTWALSAAMIVIILMSPTILQKQFGLTPKDAQVGNVLATVGLVLGAAFTGWMAGRFGAWRVIVVGCIIQSICYLVMLTAAANGSGLVVPLYALTGLSMGVIGAYPLVWVRSFPAAVRFSGFSFSYNVAYAIFGSITPVLVGFAVAWDRMSPAWYVAAVSGIAILTMLVMQTRAARSLSISQASA